MVVVVEVGGTVLVCIYNYVFGIHNTLLQSGAEGTHGSYLVLKITNTSPNSTKKSSECSYSLHNC